MSVDGAAVSDATAGRPGGATPILVATAVAGAAGYLATAVVGATRPAADYVDFGVFWATLYMIIAALSGFQQEVTRATHPLPDGTTGPRFGVAFRFGVVATAATAIVVGVISIWLAPVLFSADGWLLAIPIVVGAAGYVVVAVLCGTLYGLSLWSAVAFMIGVDGVLRLGAITAVVLAGGDVVALAWAVVLPFPVTPAILWWFFRSSVARRSTLDVRPGRLTWNVSRTLVAAVAVGVLMSGYPLFLRLAFPLETGALLGAIIFAITIVRAPLVIVVLALQSYLVVRFRESEAAAGPLFARFTVLVLAAAAVLALGATFVVPPVLGVFWPDYVLPGWFFGALVATSGLLGMLCLTGPVTLARRLHGWYAAGWAAAALVSIAALLLPMAIEAALLVSLTVGPLIGVAVHAIGARRNLQASELPFE